MRKGYKDLLAEAEARIETVAPEAAQALLGQSTTSCSSIFAIPANASARA